MIVPFTHTLFKLYPQSQNEYRKKEIFFRDTSNPAYLWGSVSSYLQISVHSFLHTLIPHSSVLLSSTPRYSYSSCLQGSGSSPRSSALLFLVPPGPPYPH